MEEFYSVFFSKIGLLDGKNVDKYGNMNCPILFSTLNKALDFIVNLYLNVKSGNSMTPTLEFWIRRRKTVKLTVCEVDSLKSRTYSEKELYELIRENFPHLDAKIALVLDE